MRKIKHNGFIIIQTCDDVIVDHSETAKCYCTIILGGTDETYDVIASYMGEYDEAVVNEILARKGLLS
jgi:hypothetical protein